VTRPPPAAAIEIIARGLPLAIIADQLGVPRSRIGDFEKWSDAFLDFIGAPEGVRGRWLRSSVVRANPTW
jgi:cytochrome P450